MLSVGAAVTGGGLSYLLGGAALAIDTITGDEYGAMIGAAAIYKKQLTPLDLAYGACRANNTCSDALDNLLP